MGLSGFNLKPLLMLVVLLWFVVDRELYTVQDWKNYFLYWDGWVNFFWDLANSALDSAECLASRLLSLSFWLTLVATLMLKQCVLLPRLEQHYKKTHAARAQRRKRRLRETLNDPVLALHMEEQLLRRRDIQGDRTKMLEAMQQIREMSQQDTADGDDQDDEWGKGGATTKGQEKYEAANAIFYGTLLVSILLFSIANTIGYSIANTIGYSQGFPGGNLVAGESLHVVSVTAEAHDSLRPMIVSSGTNNIRAIHGRRLSESWNSDACGGWGPLVFMVFFSCIHIAHSYKLLRDATRRPKRSSAPPQDEPQKSDLEQPLLPASK